MFYYVWGESRSATKLMKYHIEGIDSKIQNALRCLDFILGPNLGGISMSYCRCAVGLQ